MINCKKLCIDSSNAKTRKLFTFCFCISAESKQEKVYATIGEYMKEINPNFSYYLSPKIFTCNPEELKSLAQIADILKENLNPKEIQDSE